MKYKVGEKVRVVQCYSGGNFAVGDIVEIIQIGDDDGFDHNCYGAISQYDGMKWYLQEDEVGATALSTLQAENEKLRETVDKYATAARVIALHLKPFCDESLPYDEMIADAARKASDELEQVKRERDAAVEDVAAIIGDVEEIRRGYGVDNADADGAFAELCETYCANKGRPCYAECEKYHCKNFKWRGQKED